MSRISRPGRRYRPSVGRLWFCVREWIGGSELCEEFGDVGVAGCFLVVEGTSLLCRAILFSRNLEGCDLSSD